MWICKGCNADNWDKDENCVKCGRPRRGGDAANQNIPLRMILVSGMDNKTMYTRGESIIHIDILKVHSGEVLWSKTVPIDQITAVEIQAPSGLVPGYIQLNLSGSGTGGYFIGNINENTVMFRGMAEYDHAVEMRQYIQDWKQRQKQVAVVQPAQAVPPTSAFSVADELMKFKQLLDMGVITEDEFQKKKNELLR